MKTNDLKKGAEIILANGWKARIEDNMKGNTRLATVFGIETEMGSVYSHDIQFAIIDGKALVIEHTPEQLKLKERVERMFG